VIRFNFLSVFCLGIASHAAVIDAGQLVYRDPNGALRHDEVGKSRCVAF
jgi:hypothetical protein